ncbi:MULTISPECIES: pilus assembly PilX family protein [Pseudomonas]|uniref:PilX protein n=1 Tax=Pseudomonas syringae pv. antirrhini TaxID=251702 RepID=A0A0P9L8U4_9PSED|nr:MULTISPECIES: PilX N-terminal domain-containing pilus assembly protein [Pseudomonas]KPW49912.1 PilX protein [Pseudomonas syringae pv. antirrhini]KTC04807.1 pilus assembly protein PilX [Pseudomonas syringae ICMP 11292]RMP38073.1 PilX protein [Pseudomonas syringae pv. antirrhini]RMP44125.1 PilX protein [Pseudomonas syringae pv. antirrhini]WIN07934.1 PilX N-terminal domain-containing pilus assembly protein [Pseudomonas syringae pv. antirrhini str. 126]
MNKTVRYQTIRPFPVKQRGMVLLVSLVFLLLLTLLGISSMQNATLQEKMAGSVTIRNQSFQSAEAQLRLGESSILVANFSLAACNTSFSCAPPAESTVITAAGVGASGVKWIGGNGAFYGIQNLGAPFGPLVKCINPDLLKKTVYRVTAVAIQGPSRTVLESIYVTGC